MNLVQKFDDNTEAFIKMINDFPDDLFNTKTDEERWSAAEIAEHIFRSEYGISKLFSGESKELEDRAPDQFVEKMGKVMLDTSRKAKAFGAIIPTGELSTKKALISQFTNGRNEISEVYQKHDAHELCLNFEHPMFGYLTRLEWMEFCILHTQRHMKQMEETLQTLRA